MHIYIGEDEQHELFGVRPASQGTLVPVRHPAAEPPGRSLQHAALPPLESVVALSLFGEMHTRRGRGLQR